MKWIVTLDDGSELAIEAESLSLNDPGTGKSLPMSGQVYDNEALDDLAVALDLDHRRPWWRRLADPWKS